MGSLSLITLVLLFMVGPTFISGLYRIPPVLLPCNPSCDRRHEICEAHDDVGKTVWKCVSKCKKPCPMHYFCERNREPLSSEKYICKNYFSVTSPGFCPPVKGSLKFHSQCKAECRDDYHCDPGMKCCPSHSLACGAECKDRVKMPKCSDLH